VVVATQVAIDEVLNLRREQTFHYLLRLAAPAG
jgi:hypothetical protein